jgi:chaperone BCS1
MEDIDNVHAAKKKPVKKVNSKGHLADESPHLGLEPHELLNLIDGLVATENRIVIMTTNHPELLDSRLLRNGRVDRTFSIDFAKEEELKRFYANASACYSLPEYTEFRKLLPKKCTIADAQAQVFKN